MNPLRVARRMLFYLSIILRFDQTVTLTHMADPSPGRATGCQQLLHVSG